MQNNLIQASTLAGNLNAATVDSFYSQASFCRPSGLCHHRGLIFVTDRSCGTSVRVLFDGQVKSIIWEGGQELLQAGNCAIAGETLLITDRGHDKIRFVELGLGVDVAEWFEEIQGRKFKLGTLQISNLKKPSYVISRPSGTAYEVFISDTGNKRVVQVPVSASMDAGRPDVVCVLQRPEGMCFWSQGIAVADSARHCVYSVDLKSLDAKVIAGGANLGLGDGPAMHAAFRGPVAVQALDGQLYILERDNCALRVLENGVISTICSGRGYADGSRPQMSDPQDLLVEEGTDGFRVLVADSKNSCIRMLVREAERNILELKSAQARSAESLKDSAVRAPQSVEEISYKVQPADLLVLTLDSCGVQTQRFIADLYGPEPNLDALLSALPEEVKATLTPIAIGYHRHYQLLWNGARARTEQEKKNLRALQFLRTVSKAQLLNYEPALFKSLLNSQEQHGALLASCTGFMMKVRLSINKQPLKLNSKNQMLLCQTRFQGDGLCDVVFDLQIIAKGNFGALQTASVQLAGGLVQSPKVQYIRGKELKCFGEDFVLFFDRIQAQVDPKQIASQLQAPAKAGQLIKVVIGETRELSIMCEFGSGQEKQVVKENPRIFQLEQGSVAIYV